MSKITLHTQKTESVFTEAAEFLISSIDGQLKSGSKVLLLLSGGSAVKLYKVMSYELRVMGSNKLAIGQVDERFRPENPKSEIRNPKKKLNINKEINAEVIEETGLWKICRKKKIPYYLVSQEGALEEAAEEYNQTISKLFKEYTYKIGVLGIGEDAHTAGLLPGYRSVWDKNQLIIGYKTDHRQKSPMGQFCPDYFRQRITVTPKALRQLDQAIVVAVGEKKRKALNQLAINYDLDKYPAAVLQSIKKVDLFTDVFV